MSTSLIILAAILAVFALILIPLMMYKSGQQDPGQHAHGNQRNKHQKKKKKR